MDVQTKSNISRMVDTMHGHPRQTYRQTDGRTSHGAL